jgi:hypothetical protein
MPDLATPSPTNERPSVRGVRITRGVGLAFPPGGIVIHSQPPRLEVRQFHLRLNLATEWLEIAFECLQRAREAQAAWLQLRSMGTDSDELLNQEFKAAMQAMVAAGTFFEALYAAAREVLPQELRAKPTGGRGDAKRSAVVAEQLKRAFGLRKTGAANLASVVSEVYRYRDAAVHPSSSYAAPAIHPLLNQYVERRIAMFTFPNAQLIVRAAIAYAKILPTVGGKQGPKETRELSAYLLSTCASLFESWEAQNGSLLDASA